MPERWGLNVMLYEWLKPMPVSLFSRDYLRRKPYAMPFSATGAVGLFDWDTLDQILTGQPTADILVIARGRLVPEPIPRSLAEARALMSRAIGLVVRRAERGNPDLAALASSLTQVIPGQAHVQLFVTPAGSHGFSWHYDDEEVFIVQTYGAKDYFLRDNSVQRHRAPGTPADFSLSLKETSPIGSARLTAGDWLYIPSPWWHMAKCIEDSLSISIGISPDPSWLETIGENHSW
jgi:ribosomal protein L16 Arg81 hydroxylase